MINKLILANDCRIPPFTFSDAKSSGLTGTDHLDHFIQMNPQRQLLEIPLIFHIKIFYPDRPL